MGYIYQNGHIVIYKILTAEGFQKGLKMILLERGLWRDGIKKEDDLGLLLQQDDFDPTKLSSILDETVKSIGVWLYSGPKYHPELNFIKMYWGYSKRKVRTECYNEWESLLVRVPEDLDTVPLLFIRRSYTKCCMYIDGYRIGNNARRVDFSTKNYASHRIIPPEYMEAKEL